MWIIRESGATLLSDDSRGGKYICHSMPAGAVPVPMNAETGEREVGGYEFFYQG